MIYEIVPLPKEKWKGFPLIMDYQTSEYYDMSVRKTDGGFSMTLEKRSIAPPIVHTSDEYDFPDSLYQSHWQEAEAYGIFDGEELIGAVEVCPEGWSNRLAVTELWVKDGHRKNGVGKALMNKVKELCISRGHRGWSSASAAATARSFLRLSPATQTQSGSIFTRALS